MFNMVKKVNVELLINLNAVADSYFLDYSTLRVFLTLGLPIIIPSIMKILSILTSLDLDFSSTEHLPGIESVLISPFL